MNKITTVTKAVIAVLTTFAAMVEAKVPTGYAGWLQDAGSAIASGLLVWYVPNTASGSVLPTPTISEPPTGTQAAMGRQLP